MDQRSIPSDLDPQSFTPDLANPNQVKSVTPSDRINTLLQTRPFAFWSGVWVSVFLISVVAVGSLLSPNAAERRSVSAIAVGSDSAVATQPVAGRGRGPLWLFGAIALTCTAGSILVSRRLSQQPEPPRQRRRPRRSPPRPQPMAHSFSQTAARKRPRSTPKQPSRQVKRLKPFSPAESFLPTSLASPATASVQRSGVTTIHRKSPRSPVPTPRRAAPNAPVTQAVPTVPVTIVPTEQHHPLDWNEARLAETVDLRRRRPLRSWM